MADWLLYEHDDGRRAVAPSAEAATFAHGDPAWHRVGPVETPMAAPDDARDAARYRWLRQQHWSEAPLCVVIQPRQAVKLGHDCPALERLDAAIDKAIGANGVDLPEGAKP